MTTPTHYLWVGAILLLPLFHLNAQNASISGDVVGPEGEPVAYANVILKNLADSTIAKVEYTSESGEFALVGIAPEAYFLDVTYVGLPPYRSGAIRLASGQQLKLPTVRMKEAATELSEVTVTARRPVLEIEPDKMVFNVENSINAAGNDAMELLRKAPGVLIDNNDNISLLGRSGVEIFIDGKRSQLGSDDLANFLRSLQASDIEAIEIITSPSAKYDAEGNAGIINIRLKKDKNLGANGNVNAGYSVGEFPRYNAGISGNYRDKRRNVFGRYSYYNGRNYNDNDIFRQQNGLAFDQDSRNHNSWESHNFKAGVDFFLSEKSTLGVLVDANLSTNDNTTRARTTISEIGGPVDSILAANNLGNREANNFNYNLNYQLEPSKGVRYAFDADYGRFRGQSESTQPNTYFDPTGSEVLFQRTTFFDQPTDIDIYTFKGDHERPFLKGKLGAGVKFSYVNTRNNFGFYRVENGEQILVPERSNDFNYRENVNAAYLSYQRKLGKFAFQAGLRMEQTNSLGELTSEQEVDNETVDRSYLDWFPSAGITYNHSESHMFQLTYGRRINRPNYQDLNPFEYQLDELTFERGNPFLQPEYSNNVQLTHTFKQMLNTTIGFSHTTDLITQQTDTAGTAGAFISYLNLADQYNYSINVSAPVPITEWWSTYTSLTGVHTRNQADFGEGKVIDLAVSTFNVYGQHTFNLQKEWVLFR